MGGFIELRMIPGYMYYIHFAKCTSMVFIMYFTNVDLLNLSMYLQLMFALTFLGRISKHNQF